MADTGKEILDGSSYKAPWDASYSSLGTFGEYLDALNERRSDLEACGITFPAVIDTRRGEDWARDYHREDDINLKAFRDDAAALRGTGEKVGVQLDLIRQTEELPESWGDAAAQAALENYAKNSALMEQDRAHLIEHANVVEQVARNIEDTLSANTDPTRGPVGKAGNASLAVGGLVRTLNNNVPDFETRLDTAIESMKANNQGGIGLTNRHPYRPHGPFSGGNWNADDVRNDIQTCVIAPFAVACQALKDSNTNTTQHLKEQYQLLLEALNASGRPGESALTSEQREQVGRWSQITSEGDGGGGDCSRWAIVSALANKYGVREGPNGPEINLPAEVQQRLTGGMPLGFPPTKAQINQIASRQYNAKDPIEGFQGGPSNMSDDLNRFLGPGSSTYVESRNADELVQQLRADVQSGRAAIVNGAFPGSDGHFISITGIDENGNFLVNDSNRQSNGDPNAYGTTISRTATDAEIRQFFQHRINVGESVAAGYSTVQ